MAKFNLKSTGVLASIILLLSAVYARPQTPDKSPFSEYQHRLEGNGNLHAISVRYHNTPYYTYDGHKTGENHRNASQETRKARMIPQPPNKEKFLYSDERHVHPEGKSLEPTFNSKNTSGTVVADRLAINGSDANNISLPSPLLARGTREQNANTLKHLWNYQSHKPPTKWTWPSKIEPPYMNIQPLGKIRPRCVKGGELYCTEIDNYPTEQLEQIISSTPERYQDVFGNDVIITPVNITQRIDIEEETLCDSKEALIYPKAGLSIDNEWQYIVNLGNHTQGIRVEECTNPDSKCEMTDSFPFGYKTQCKQKYIYRQLLGFNKEGRVEKNLYQFPSCCQCVLKRNLEK